MMIDKLSTRLFPRLSQILMLLVIGCCGACHQEQVEAFRPSVAASPFRDFRYHANHGTIHAIISGGPRGPRIVYVHGMPGRATDWTPFLRRPIGGLECVAIDRPGSGRSDPLPDPGLSSQAAALEPLLCEVGDRRPILVGHSYGAAVVARAAIDFPDQIGGIVLISGALNPRVTESTPIPFWLRELPEAVRLEDDLSELESDLPRLRCPVIVIHGVRDDVVPIELAQETAAKMVNSHRIYFAAVDGSGHDLAWEVSRSEDVRELVRNLISSNWLGNRGN